ncbi:MAG: phosphoglycerate mutase (2,3-diphosphoglycerate-independent) [Thermodesulfobacteriota bacterium]
MAAACEADLIRTINRLYQQGLTDYFMEPLILVDGAKNPIGPVRNGDGVIFCCRRGEREIQLSRSFVDPAFKEFGRANLPDLKFVILTLYHEMFLKMPVAVAFPPASELKDTIGDVVSQNGLRQLRIAESEKFAHVTFFLNGNSNRVFNGEDHIKIPSPKDIPFDQVPELSGDQVSEELIRSIHKGIYGFIVVNFPNGDIIGHHENRTAKIKCAEAIDRQLEKVLASADQAGYVTVITADHGILETAFRPDGLPNLSHTHNPVPFIIVYPASRMNTEIQLRKGGSLADIAPTVLQIMGLAKPKEMTGDSLVQPPFTLSSKRKVLLIILDGWGIGKSDETNNIYMARTPVWDRLTAKCPFTQLNASGKSVGLLDWKPGNSEAGHQTIGAGRSVIQDDARIDLAIETGSFFENPVFLDVLETVKQRGSSLHLIALMSEKSSHGSIAYPTALLRMAKEINLNKVFVHAIFDGRSTKIRSAPVFIEKLEAGMNSLGIGRIASGIGRGFALDRDGDYHKTRRAYDALVYGAGIKVGAV